MTSATNARSLLELLEESARKHASRPLFLTKIGGRWRETTYAAVALSVRRLRAGLASLGVGRGDRVGIIAGNREEWAVIAYACYGLGAVVVPMYESQHERDWEFVLGDSGAKVVFVSGAVYERALRRLTELASLEYVIPLSDEPASVTYRSLVASGAAEAVPKAEIEPTETCALLYTSGTTGEAKGVMLSHENILSNVLALKQIVLESGENPEDHRSLSILPWAHAFGQTVELHLLIASGASMAIAESVDKIASNIGEVKPTVLVAVPRVFVKIHAGIEKLMEQRSPAIRWLFRRGLAAGKKLGAGQPLGLTERWLRRIADRLIFAKVRARFGGRLRFAISGAASLPKEVAEFVDALGITVFEGYGLTETSPIAAANVPGRRKIGSVGRALPGVRIVIDRSVSEDPSQGEIVVYGPNVMRGYYKRDAETRGTLLPDGGLRSGDLGYLDDDDYLFVTGRIKEQYKLTNGKYVSPAPLEDRLKLSRFVANVMIYGDNRESNVALVVPEAATLIEWARDAGLAERSLERLVEEPRVKQKLYDEIERLSVDFRNYERIGAIALLAEDFTLENEMLTPSLKLRRRKVIARWAELIDGLYREEAKVDSHR